MTRIVIVGVGALGSHLALFARNWDARLVLVDHDRVESKNLMSQLHTKMGVGKNKAQALGQALQGLFGVRVETVPRRLVEANAEALVSAADLVVDCVDHGPTRQLLARTCVERGVPCLHGALAADGAYARVMWAPRFEVDAGGEGEPTCADGEHLPFIALVAAKMAWTVQRFLEHAERHDTHVHPNGMEPI